MQVLCVFSRTTTSKFDKIYSFKSHFVSIINCVCCCCVSPMNINHKTHCLLAILRRKGIWVPDLSYQLHYSNFVYFLYRTKFYCVSDHINYYRYIIFVIIKKLFEFGFFHVDKQIFRMVETRQNITLGPISPQLTIYQVLFCSNIRQYHSNTLNLNNGGALGFWCLELI